MEVPQARLRLMMDLISTVGCYLGIIHDHCNGGPSLTTALNIIAGGASINRSNEIFDGYLKPLGNQNLRLIIKLQE